MVRFIAALLFSLAFVTPARAAVYEAESMSKPDGSVITHPVTASGGEALAFLENGTATQTIGPAQSITVRARGGIDCGGFPHLSVTLDGSPLFDTTLGSYGWTKTTVPVSTSGGELGLTFDNALTTPDCQRILRVDVVRTSEPEGAWRPYSASSVWNQTIAQKGGVLQGSNPASGEFGTMFFGALSGGDLAYSKPIYFADGDEQCRSVRLRNPDWNTGDTQIPDSDCIPVPSGLQAATGSDGHLIVISADRKTAWAFWRCKQGSDSGSPCTEANVLSNGYDAANGSKWRLDPSDPLADGVADCCGDATGRGSGTELVTNVLKQDEAALGVEHVMGLTTPGTVHSGAIYPPALKSDGSNSGSRLKYGMLFALRPDYPCPSAIGPQNVCNALKTYGVYLVDQASASGSEIDTTGVNAQSPAAGWSSVGISRNALPLTGSDWRCVDLPGVTGECP